RLLVVAGNWERNPAADLAVAEHAVGADADLCRDRSHIVWNRSSLTLDQATAKPVEDAPTAVRIRARSRAVAALKDRDHAVQERRVGGDLGECRAITQDTEDCFDSGGFRIHVDGLVDLCRGERGNVDELPAGRVKAAGGAGGDDERAAGGGGVGEMT